MSKTENTHKMTIRLSPVTEFRLERDYRLDGSRSKNEFIERAITRYQDLLEVEQNETLPTAWLALLGRVRCCRSGARGTQGRSGVTAVVFRLPSENPSALCLHYKGSTLKVGERSGLIIGPSGADYTVTSSDPDTVAVEQESPRTL